MIKNFAFLCAAAILVPAASWAQEVSDPECVESPYGCPGGSGGGSNGDDWPVPIPGPNAAFQWSRPFVGATCVTSNQWTEKCFHETGGQAVARLGKKVTSGFVHGLAEEALRMKFPYEMSRSKIYIKLAQLEIEMIKALEKQFQEDLKRMEPMTSDSYETQMRKLQMIAADTKVINEWAAAAKQAAGYGSWTDLHRRRTFEFNGGLAYRQLGETLVGKEWFR
ncbi:MAG: hypothetical protein HY924_11165 [Elusimicrobia bacterium]|nr:hypothetical protein [Elusimicrobiota bacterium]